jgi:hypothetical protein
MAVQDELNFDNQLINLLLWNKPNNWQGKKKG